MKGGRVARGIAYVLLVVADVLLAQTPTMSVVGCPSPLVQTYKPNDAAPANESTTKSITFSYVAPPVTWNGTLRLNVELQHAPKFVPSNLSAFSTYTQSTDSSSSVTLSQTISLYQYGLWVIRASVGNSTAAMPTLAYIITTASCAFVMGYLPALSVSPAVSQVEPGTSISFLLGVATDFLSCGLVVSVNGIYSSEMSPTFSPTGVAALTLPRSGVYALLAYARCSLPQELFSWQGTATDLFNASAVSAAAAGPTFAYTPRISCTYVVPINALAPTFDPVGGGPSHPFQLMSLRVNVVVRELNTTSPVNTFFLVLSGVNDLSVLPSYSSPSWKLYDGVTPISLQQDSTIYAFTTVAGKIKSDIAASQYSFSQGAATWMYVVPAIVLGIAFGVYLVYLIIATFSPPHRSEFVDFSLTGLTAMFEVVSFATDIAFVASCLAVNGVDTAYQVIYSILIIMVAILVGQRILWSGRFRETGKQWHFIPGVNVLQLFRADHAELIHFEQDRMWWSGFLHFIEDFPGLVIVGCFSSQYPTRTMSISVAKLFLCIGGLVFGFQSTMLFMLTFPRYFRRYCGRFFDCDWDADDDEDEAKVAAEEANAKKAQEQGVAGAESHAPDAPLVIASDPFGASGGDAATATGAAVVLGPSSPARELLDDVLVAREVHLLRQLKAVKEQQTSATENIFGELRRVQETSNELSTSITGINVNPTATAMNRSTANGPRRPSPSNSSGRGTVGPYGLNNSRTSTPVDGGAANANQPLTPTRGAAPVSVVSMALIQRIVSEGDDQQQDSMEAGPGSSPRGNRGSPALLQAAPPSSPTEILVRQGVTVVSPVPPSSVFPPVPGGADLTVAPPLTERNRLEPRAPEARLQQAAFTAEEASNIPGRSSDPYGLNQSTHHGSVPSPHAVLLHSTVAVSQLQQPPQGAVPSRSAPPAVGPLASQQQSPQTAGVGTTPLLVSAERQRPPENHLAALSQQRLQTPPLQPHPSSAPLIEIVDDTRSRGPSPHVAPPLSVPSKGLAPRGSSMADPFALSGGGGGLGLMPVARNPVMSMSHSGTSAAFSPGRTQGVATSGQLSPGGLLQQELDDAL